MNLPLAPAKLTKFSGDQSVREGSNSQLFCEASGKPTPNITWTRVLEDGSNSEVLHEGPTWDFLNINRTSSGTYRCTGYNGIGNPISHKVKVNVTCKFLNLYINVEGRYFSKFHVLTLNPFTPKRAFRRYLEVQSLIHW